MFYGALKLTGSVVMYWLVLSGSDTCQADSLQKRRSSQYVHLRAQVSYGALKLTGSVVMYWLVLSGSDTCQADSLQKRRVVNMYIFVLRCLMELSSLLVVW